MPIKAVIFDYDGVIVDSFMNQYDVMRHICKISNKKFPYKSPKDLRNNYEEPFTIMYEKCGFDWERDMDFLVKEYIDYTKEKDIPLVQGIESIIRELADSGSKLGIVTQNGYDVVMPKLKYHSLDHYFSSIVTIQDGFKVKPDPEGLLYCIKKLGVLPEESLYFGDFPSDVKTARAAGTHSVSYLNGYASKKKFNKLPKEEYSYTVFIKKPKEILQQVLLLNQ